jgi:hypothetical protein
MKPHAFGAFSIGTAQVVDRLSGEGAGKDSEWIVSKRTHRAIPTIKLVRQHR